MRHVRCRKCWQLTPMLAKNCTSCGDADGTRRLWGVAELSVFIVGGLAVVGAMIGFVIART
jgi:hypothetical protein